MDAAGVDVVVLAGGLGTRLTSVVPDRPKVLAPISGKPYLDYLLRWLAGFQFRRIILSLGHRASDVTEYLREHPHADLQIVPVIEPMPLGTAGAVNFVRGSLKSEPVLIINGDTFVDADLSDFVAMHLANGCEASMVCAKVMDCRTYGTVEIDADGLIRIFREKIAFDAPRPGIISAGIYLASEMMLDRISNAPGPSLERDVFAALPAGAVHAYLADGEFIDIGTPAGLIGAGPIFDRHFALR